MNKAPRLITCTIAAFLAATVTLAEPAKPTAEHARLALFVGKFKVEGVILGRAIRANQTCKWFEGGFAVTCRVTPLNGGQTLAIFSYNMKEKIYEYHSISSAGGVTNQKGPEQGGVFTFVSDSGTGGKVEAVVKPLPIGYLLTISIDGKQIEETTYTKL
ncbi:MAG: hypothetical protein U1F35_11120 [Steroidobacteraceae bacterium]